MYFICNFCDTLENYFEKLTTARKCAREVVLAALKVPRHLYLSHWLLDTFEKKTTRSTSAIQKIQMLSELPRTTPMVAKLCGIKGSHY